MTNTIDHELTPEERETLKKISSFASCAFSESVAIFLRGCAKAGFDTQFATAAFAVFGLSSIVKVLLLGSGMSLDELSDHEVGDVTEKTQELLSSEVSKIIAQHNAIDVADFN